MSSPVGSFLTNRFSQHPERYLEIFRVFRKYGPHQVVAELSMTHSHAEDDELLELTAPHAFRRLCLASTLEELGPCFIKLGQVRTGAIGSSSRGRSG
jgi:predicted unusual protein kinase regulating ubiquinone biosynthesis (AarF/ABC1/UbiB family)